MDTTIMERRRGVQRFTQAIISDPGHLSVGYAADIRTALIPAARYIPVYVTFPPNLDQFRGKVISTITPYLKRTTFIDLLQ